jgi:hypothetical protein
MPDAIITSTASTFGTISGTFAADQSTITGTVSGVVPGTLTGSVGVPGPAGAAGAPGQGVPAGGTAGQYLQKIDGTNYNTDWVTLNLGNYALLSGADFTGRVSVPSITGDEVVVIPGFNIVPTQTEPTHKVDGDLWVYDDEGLTPSKFRVFLESETQNIATESWVTTSFAPKASPVFTGDPRAPTPASGDNDTSIATTAFVKVQGYVTSAALTGYAPLASPVFTGNPTAPTPTFGDNDTSISTTAFVQAALAGGTAVAKNLEVEVRNQSGSTIPAGSIVYISGATGNKPLITLAQANNDANSAQTMGFTKTAIANNAFGYVIVRGEVENLDTSALTEGAQLYLSPTVAGAYTTTKPSAPQHMVYVGIVIRAHPTHGTILVAVQNGYELHELHDVALSSEANNDLLAYESSTDLWKNKTFSALGLLTSANAATTYAPIASPTFTGTVTIPAGASISGFAPLASPTFTGTPSLPTGTIGVTQTAGDNTTALATTAFVTAAVPAFAAVTAVINNPTSTTTSVNPFTLVNGLCNPNVRNLCIMTATAVSGSGASGGSTVAASGIREMYTNAVSSAGRSGFYFGKTDVTPGYNNSNWRLINWSKKVIVSGRAMMGSTDYSTNYNGDSNTLCRILLGGRAATVTTGNMTQKGISLFKVGGNATAVQLQVHDGTTATTVASSFTPATGEAFSWTLYSDGAGNVTLYINGSSVATSSAGPTGNSTAYYTQYGEQVEATASAAVRQILYCFGGQLYIET